MFTPISFLEIVLGTLSALIIGTFGLAVYLKNPKSWTNRFFACLSFIFTIYPLANAFALHPPILTLENNLFWIRMDMFLGSFMAFFLLLLAHTFPGDKFRMPKREFALLSFITIINVIISWTPLVFHTVGYPNGSKTPLPQVGFGMPFYALTFFGLTIASFIILFRRYKKETGEEKIRTLYLLIGISAAFFLIGIIVLLFVVIFKYSGTVFLGPVFPVILMVCIGYAIIKHKFLDIEPIIARAVSYSLLIAFLIMLYSVVLFYGANVFLGLSLSMSALFINAGLAVVVAVTFKPLHSLVSSLTDKFLFKGMYDAPKILSDLTHAITSTIDFDVLAENLLLTVVKEMRVSKSALVLIQDGELSTVRQINFFDGVFTGDLEFIKFVVNLDAFGKPCILLGDLNNEIHKDLFRKYALEAVFTIRANNKIVAVLLLGGKLSGLPYSSQDLGLLDVFASESGIAIQNSRLYKNLQLALDAKSRFITVVSHQLRTPVAGIKWGLESLQHENSATEQKDILSSSYERSIFLEQQIDDIVLALDIYDKKIFIQKNRCNLADMFNDIIIELKQSIDRNKIIINIAINEEAQFLQADEQKLKKILRTIVKNAVLYSNTGQTVSIESVLGNKGKTILISVNDQGIGITDIENKHIFEEFFRSDRARSKVPDGLGLEMFIAKAFIGAHKGKVSVYSRGVDTGSSIQIKLPLK
jgi:signal transduction histidine kinase